MSYFDLRSFIVGYAFGLLDRLLFLFSDCRSYSLCGVCFMLGMAHFSAFDARGWGGGGYTSEFLVGVCRPAPQILTQFQTEIFHFPRPFSDLAPVVQRPDNFIRWIRHYSGSKIYFTLHVAHIFRTLPNLAVVRVCIFACTQRNTEIFAQIETVG